MSFVGEMRPSGRGLFPAGPGRRFIGFRGMGDLGKTKALVNMTTKQVKNVVKKLTAQAEHHALPTAQASRLARASRVVEKRTGTVYSGGSFVKTPKAPPPAVTDTIAVGTQRGRVVQGGKGYVETWNGSSWVLVPDGTSTDSGITNTTGGGTATQFDSGIDTERSTPDWMSPQDAGGGGGGSDMPTGTDAAAKSTGASAGLLVLGAAALFLFMRKRRKSGGK